MTEILLPDEVFRHIFTFLPYSYRRTNHFDALDKDDIFTCFKIKINFFYKYHNANEWSFTNNFFVYKRWFILKRVNLFY